MTSSAIFARCSIVGGFGFRNSGRHITRNGHCLHLTESRHLPSRSTISWRMRASLLVKAIRLTQDFVDGLVQQKPGGDFLISGVGLFLSHVLNSQRLNATEVCSIFFLSQLCHGASLTYVGTRPEG